jgi:hypothetical protein
MFASPHLAAALRILGTILWILLPSLERAGAQGPPDTLQLAPASALSLGEFGVPGAVTVSAAEGIFVIDRDARRVIAFDGVGAMRWAMGRSGAGPGEFRAPSGIWAIGDSIRVYDATLRRISALDQAGRFGGSEMLTSHAGAAGFPSVVAMAGDHTSVVQWLTGVRAGYRRDTTVVSLHSRGGPTLELGRFPADDRLTLRSEDSFYVFSPPWSARLRVDACGGSVVLSTGVDPALRFYDVTGRLDRQVPLTFLPARVAESTVRRADVAWAKERAELDRTFRTAPALEALDNSFRLGRVPAVLHDVLFDPRCRVWVAAAAAPSSPRRWWRLDANGQPAATLMVEEHAEVRAFGVDVVVIERTDADGVRTLSAHRLAAR